MLFRFVPRELPKLDGLDAEVLVGTVFSDVRPAKGVVGLCDWRLGGRLSRLMREGFLSGTLGEVVMLPGRPALAFEKLLVFGAGERAAFDRERLTTLVVRVAEVLAGLRARTAVVELPGRADALVSAVDAADAALGALGRMPEGTIDTWTLVEDSGGRAAIEAHVADLRRKLRRLPEPTPGG